MAEESKTLLLSLQFDTDEGLKRAADFRSAIDADKEALSELNKVIKKNGEQNQEQLVQREKLQLRIKENTDARREELRSVEKYLQATKGAIDANGKYTGSLNNLKGNLSFLTAKYNDLTKAERENVEVGVVMQKEIKRLSDALKQEEGQLGDNRRSVGGYLDAIRQAPGAMGKFKAGLDGIGTAMKANPMGLIVSLLPMITQLFNSSGEGADFFAKAMSIVNAVVQEGLKRVVALGGAMFKLLTGDVKGAWNEGKAAMSGFTASVNAAVKSGGELADRLDALEVAESKFTVTQARAKKEIDALLIQARNRTTAEAERIRLYEKAEKLEVRLNAQALKLAKERLAIIQLENKVKQGDEDEENKRVNEQLARITELETESANIQEKIQVRKDAIADAAAEREKNRREKAAADAKALAEKQAKEEIERLEDIEKKRQWALAETARVKEELAAIDKKISDEKAEMEAFLLSVEIANAQNNAAREEKELREKLARKQAEYDATLSFVNGTQALMAALANENSAFAEFEKGLTLFRIGLASAEALTKGIAASQDLGFPANLIAMAGTIAQVTANLIQAKQMIDGTPPPAPKSKFSEGGVLDGPSHAEGGIKGTGAFANVEVEGKEIILTKGVYLNPALRAVANQLNIMGGGKPLAPTNYAAMGGILNPSIYSGANASGNAVQGIDYNKLAKAVGNQPIYVIPTEIRDQANASDARKVRAGLGKKAA